MRQVRDFVAPIEPKKVRKVVVFQTRRENGVVTNSVSLRHQKSPEEDRKEFSSWCLPQKERIAKAIQQVKENPTIMGRPIPVGFQYASESVKRAEIARIANCKASEIGKVIKAQRQISR
jgi:hypothetical protein